MTMSTSESLTKARQAYAESRQRRLREAQEALEVYQGLIVVHPTTHRSGIGVEIHSPALWNPQTERWEAIRPPAYEEVEGQFFEATLAARLGYAQRVTKGLPYRLTSGPGVDIPETHDKIYRYEETYHDRPRVSNVAT